MNREMWLLKPTIRDFIMKSSRGTQIIYPKDLGYICAQVGLSPGMIVVEAGTGSGAMTSFLANIIRPNGHVYSYEMNERFLNIARKNLERACLLDCVTLKLADVKLGIDVKNADVAILDLGDPWLLVRIMRDALRPGGFLAAVTPTYNQAEKLCEELNGGGFVEVETVELMVRRLQVKQGMTRPETRMIAHTAFITTARKTD
jgi:tRNA (adenine57-N1/adenine58-N1)-methyltransferase